MMPQTFAVGAVSMGLFLYWFYLLGGEKVSHTCSFHLFSSFLFEISVFLWCRRNPSQQVKWCLSICMEREPPFSKSSGKGPRGRVDWMGAVNEKDTGCLLLGGLLAWGWMQSLKWPPLLKWHFEEENPTGSTLFLNLTENQLDHPFLFSAKCHNHGQWEISWP